MAALFNPTMRAVKEQLYQSERPWVVDSTKFERIRLDRYAVTRCGRGDGRLVPGPNGGVTVACDHRSSRDGRCSEHEAAACGSFAITSVGTHRMTA